MVPMPTERSRVPAGLLVAHHHGEAFRRIEIVARLVQQRFRHSDNLQATGFVEHLKLPHYVDFQAELGLVRACAPSSRRAAPQPDMPEAAE